MLPLLLVGGALAAEGLTLGVPVEYDVLGQNIGVRPEILWRPQDPEGALNLRAAVGLLPGPEYLYLPVSGGARWDIGRAKDWPVRPLVGLGAEAQTFVISDHAPVFRVGFYLEAGAAWVMGDNAFGLAVAPDLSLFNRPGAGVSARLTWTHDL